MDNMDNFEPIDAPEASAAPENGPPGSDAMTVDEILRDIMREDGSFNDSFNDLFSRYLGGSAPDPRESELFDRTGEARPRTRVEYTDERAGESRYASDRTPGTADRISEKLSPDVREMYSRETQSAIRPAFTHEGTVKYPSMGVGESEERVVFDAEWEAKAKKEAARLEKVRRENMLKGDSANTRSFRFSSADESYGRPNINPSYIDPLDDSRDVPLYSSRSGSDGQGYRQSGGRNDSSFFPEGFSESQRRNNAVDGKTDIVYLNDGNKNRSAATAVKGGGKNAAEAAVIEAFAQNAELEDAFRDRWKPTVEAAEQRREKQAVEKQRQAAVRRAEKIIAQREMLTAAAEEENMKASKPMDLREFAAENAFEEIPEPEQLSPEAFTPRREVIPIPEAEHIDEFAQVPERARREYHRQSGEKAPKKNAQKKQKKKKKDKKNDPRSRKERWVEDNIPRKGDSAGEIFRKVVRGVSLIVLIAALVYLAVYGVNYLRRKQQTADFDQQIRNAENLSDQQLKDLWADVKANYPEVDFPEGMQVKFAKLYAINPDLVGWLKIDNTNIATPLLQKPGDNYYYLYHDIYKKSSRYGNPYIHCDSNMGKDGLSRNTIVYGHNTHDGLMFHQLTNYMTAEGYLKAPVITMDTLYETTKWKIFAVMLTNSTPDGDSGYVFDYLYPEFSSDEVFMNKIEEIYARSMIHTGVDVKKTDKILTLYTCYQNYFKGGRLVILARQLRKGESEKINAADVYYDKNAHFPDAYYGKYATEAPAATAAPAANAANDSDNALVITAASGENSNGRASSGGGSDAAPSDADATQADRAEEADAEE